MHNARLNVDGKALYVPVNSCSMRVCFWPDMAVVAVENPTYRKNLIHISPVVSEDNCRSSSNHQAGTWHF